MVKLIFTQKVYFGKKLDIWITTNLNQDQTTPKLFKFDQHDTFEFNPENLPAPHQQLQYKLFLGKLNENNKTINFHYFMKHFETLNLDPNVNSQTEINLEYFDIEKILNFQRNLDFLPDRTCDQNKNFKSYGNWAIAAINPDQFELVVKFQTINGVILDHDFEDHQYFKVRLIEDSLDDVDKFDIFSVEDIEKVDDDSATANDSRDQNNNTRGSNLLCGLNNSCGGSVTNQQSTFWLPIRILKMLILSKINIQNCEMLLFQP